MEKSETIYNKNGIYIERITNEFDVFLKAEFMVWDSIERRNRDRFIYGKDLKTVISDIKYIKRNG